MDPEVLDALDRFERRLSESAATTQRLFADSETRTHAHVDGRLGASEERMRSYLDGRFVEVDNRMRSLEDRVTESEERTRRHVDVVAESLRVDIRTLAEGIMTVAQSSVRRDAELGERIDRLEPRVVGLESRVSVLERSRPRRRRRG